MRRLLLAALFLSLGFASSASAQNIAMTLDDPPSASGTGGTFAQPVLVRGWALDTQAGSGTGIDYVHVWAYPSSGGSPVFFGAATLNKSRPDIGAYFGSQFNNAGFELSIIGRPEGAYQLVVWAHSTINGGAFDSRSVNVTLTAHPVMFIDGPQNASTVNQPFQIQGWAVDLAAASGGGVDAIHVWAYPDPGSGKPPIFIGSSNLGAYRPDVGAALGNSRFNYSGFQVAFQGRPADTYYIVVYARSVLTGTFNHSQSLTVFVDPSVATPSFSVASGTYSSSLSVSVSTTTPEAIVRYTTNGTEPTASSVAVTGPIAINASQTIKAKGFRNLWQPSATASATYTLQVIAPTFSLNSGTYNQPQSVNLSTGTPNAIIRYRTDGQEPTGTSPIASGPIAINSTQTIKAKAFREGWLQSETTTATYTLQVLAPTISLPPGSYTVGQTLTFTVADGAATIRYRTDGGEPNEFSPSVGSGQAIAPLTGSYTVYAKAFRTGFTPSAQVGGLYAFLSQAEAPNVSPAQGTYDIGQTVTFTVSEPAATMYYRTDGQEPTASYPSIQIFSGQSITLNEPATVTARAFRPNYAPSNVVSRLYTLRLPPPTMSPTGGNYASGVSVSVSTPSSGATIRYTTDRGEPTSTSTAYVGQIWTGDDMTIKARTYKDGWAPSDVVTATYINTQAPIQLSPGVTTTSFVSPTGLNAVGGMVRFGINNATFSPNPSDTAVYRNGVRIPAASVSVTGGTVDISSALQDGRNYLELTALDSQGRSITGSVVAWSGNRSLVVTVRDPAGAAISGATVIASLSQDGEVTASGITNANGQTALYGLPSNQVVRLAATANGYMKREIALQATQTSAALSLDIDNNSFAQGLSGWTVAAARALIVGHSEASIAPVDCSWCLGRAQAATQAITSSIVSNSDLFLDATNQSSPQTVTRVFVAGAGTRRVQLRYRFQSDEVYTAYPYYGWYYDDSYTVRIRSLTTGQSTTDSQTVSSLWGYYDANASTPWFTLSRAVTPGEQLEVTLSVTNVGDNGHGSWLYVDFVAVDEYRITNVDLRDLIVPGDQYATARPERTLSRLSTSVMPTGLQSYDGYVRIHGTITIEGPPTEQLQDVRIEIWDNGVKAIGHLARSTVSAVRSQLLNRPLGSTSVGETSAGVAPVLFEIPSTQFAQFSQTTDTSDLAIQIHATLTSGVEIHPILTMGQVAHPEIAKRFTKLVMFTDANKRMAGSGRDLGLCSGLRATDPAHANRPDFPCGGDSWALPSVVSFANSVQAVTWNDFSNMNGGFFPYHGTHRSGADVDGTYSGYSNRDAASAQTMIGHLNAHGRKIDRVFVAYVQSASDAFWNAIKDVQLTDGRLARDVIRPDAGHKGHFHWRLNPALLQ